MDNRLADFYTKFEQPYIDETIMGFSGIDPAPKGSSIPMNGALPDDADEIRIYDHEELENISGGDEYDHYHLTGEEYMLLQEILERKRGEIESGEISITITQDEYEKLLALFEAVYPNNSEAPVLINEEALNDLIDLRIMQYMNELDS